MKHGLKRGKVIRPINLGVIADLKMNKLYKKHYTLRMDICYN